MGYLGFDHDRLALLSGAIGQAVGNIGGQRSTDAAAARAMAALDVAVGTLRSWDSTVRALLGNACLDSYTPATLLLMDFANAALYEQQTVGGWTVLTDPSGDLPLSEEEQTMQAKALGQELRDPSVIANLDATRRAQLQTELDRIKQSKPASKAFIDALGDDGLVNVTDALARDHSPAAADGKLDPASIQVEGLLGTIGTIINNLRSKPTDPVAPVILHLDPVAAAFIVRLLDIDAVQLGKLTNELLKRWLFVSPADDGRTDGSYVWSQSPQNTTGGPGDVLIAHLLTVPGASTTYVDIAIDEAPRVLFGTASQPVFERLMIDSVNPAHATSEQAKHIALTLFDVQRMDHHQPDYIEATMANIADRSYLGEMVAPWVMQFIGAPADANRVVSPGPGWNIDLKTGFIDLQVMMADKTSNAFLTEHTNAWLGELKSGTWADIHERLGEILGLLTELRGASLNVAIRAQAARDALRTMVTNGFFSLIGIFNLPVAATAALAVVNGWAAHASRSAGSADLRKKSAFEFDGQLTATAYTMAQQIYANTLPKRPVDTSVDTAVAPPPPPPLPPPAPDTTVKTGLSRIYSHALLAWTKSLPPTATKEVDEMVELVLNPIAVSSLIADEST